MAASLWDTLLDLQRALEAATASDWLEDGTAAGDAYPPLNVFRQGEDFVVVAEIPGARKEDLEISLSRNQLRLAGRRLVEYPEGASLHRRERSSGSFDRTLSFPVDVDPDGVKAEYREGILAVFVPRAERERARVIDVG